MKHQLNPRSVLCPRAGCGGNGAAGEIVIHSQAERRYKCLRGGHTFAATHGTPFYRLHHAADLMTLVLALLAHGCPVQAIVFAFRLHENTVHAWLLRGGTHAQQVHQHLVLSGQVEEVHVQADELWVKLRRGRVWQALALAVSSRLWLAGQISRTRDQTLIETVVRQVRRSLRHGGVLVCVDGLASYVGAFQRLFAERTQYVGAGIWRVALPSGFQLGQVIKQRVKYRLTSITRRAVVGAEAGILAVLTATHTGTQIHTAFIERLNSTFRCSWAHLARRSRSLADQETTLIAGMYLVGTVYNFCRAHDTLRIAAPRGRQTWQVRTPAMAAGLTDHCWTLSELLWWRPLPPSSSPAT